MDCSESLAEDRPCHPSKECRIEPVNCKEQFTCDSGKYTYTKTCYDVRHIGSIGFLNALATVFLAMLPKGRCINSTLECNKQNDCGDNSDERDCGELKKVCAQDKFHPIHGADLIGHG